MNEKNLLRVMLFLALLSISFNSKGQSCSINLTSSAGPTIVNAGDTACLETGYAGSITIRAGAVLRVCSDTVRIGSTLSLDPQFGATPPGRLIITAGTVLDIDGSFDASDVNEQVFYEGPGTCEAQVLVSGSASSPGPLTTFSNLWFDGPGFTAGNVGSGNLGVTTTTPLCPFVQACEPTSCNDTTIATPDDICVNDSTDLTTFETTVETGTWSIQSTPAGSNPAIIDGDFFTSRNNADAGTYLLRFTLDDAGAGGCPPFAEREVEVLSPSVDLGNDTALCVGDTILLDAGAGLDYVWTPGGSTNQTLEVTTADEYIVEVEDAAGCTNRDTIDVSFNVLPSVDLGNDTALCVGDTIELDAGAGLDYVWTPGGSTNQTIEVTTADEYIVEVTDGNNCSNRDTIDVSFNALPSVDLGNDTALCVGDTIELDAGAGLDYVWTPGGSTNQTLEVTTADEYIVEVTDGNNCSNRDTIDVSFNALPSVDLGNDTALCVGDTIELDAGAGLDYVWTPGGSTNQTIEVTTADEYIVEVTDGNNCSNRDTIDVSFNALPSVDLGNDTALCVGDTIELDAGAGLDYVWTPGGSTNQTLEVTTADEYIVEVTDGNNCSNRDTIDVSFNALPSVDLGNDTALCVGDTIELDAGAGLDYVWTPGGSTNQTIEVTTADEYIVEVTDGNNCSNRDTIDVSFNALPSVDLGNDTALCVGDTIELDAGAGLDYVWTPGGSTNQTIEVTTADEYIVEVTDGNNCSNRDTIDVSFNALPSVDLGNDTALCVGDTIELDAGAGLDYVWTPGGSTNQTIEVTTADEYIVEVTDGNNCSNRDTIDVSFNALPTVDIGGDRSICTGDTLELDAGVGFVGYEWTPGGSTNQTLDVFASGLYTVEVEDANGCFNLDSMTLTVDTSIFVDLGIDTSICVGDDITLNPGIGFTNYDWFPNNETSPTITVSVAGTYAVEVTDGNGCTGSDTINIVLDSLPIVDLGNDTALCQGDTLTLFAGSGYASYDWFPNGETIDSINVFNADTYAVEITDGNGCSGTDTIEITIDSIPLVDLGNDTALCQGDTLTLFAGSGYVSYDWSPNGEIADSINVFNTDTYAVEITDGNGCSGTDTIEITIDSIPLVNLGNDTALCQGDTLTLFAGSGYVSYDWSPNGEIADSINVFDTDTYAVQVIDGNGCSGSDTIEITVNNLPLIDLGGDRSICIDDTLELDAGAGFANYEWTPGGSTAQTLDVFSSGIYSVEVTDLNNCINIDSMELTVDSSLSVNLGPDTSICFGNTIELDAGAGFNNYDWFPTNESSRTIIVDTSGTYAVEVTDIQGCSGTDTIQITVNSLPSFTLRTDTSLCRGDSIFIGTNINSANYNWNSGAITDSIFVGSSGNYRLTVTDTNGCVFEDSVLIDVNDLPEINLGIDTIICNESDYILDAGGDGGDYLWNTLATSQTISTTGTGIYAVRVTTPNGCEATDTIEITNHPSPDIQLNFSDTSICGLDTLILDGGNWDTYEWQPGGSTDSTLEVSSSGEYTLRVTNEFGCEDRDTVNIGVSPNPNANLGEDREVCEFEDVELTATELNATYLWSTSDTTRSILTNQAGLYWVEVTNAFNCVTRDSIELTPGDSLNIDLGSDAVICPGESHFLSIAPFDSIRWSDGTDQTSLEVFESDTIDVFAVNSEGCFGRDTVLVTLVGNPFVNLLPDTSICELEQEVLEIPATSSPNVSYEWNTGSNDSILLVEFPDTYIVQVTDSNDCFASDSVVVAPFCRPITITMPNIFTPNNDGVNDYFVPLETFFEDVGYMSLNVNSITFEVYNRWGAVIHSSTGVIPKWSGFNEGGVRSPSGTYFWILDYELINGEKYSKNGFVKLLSSE